MSTPKGRIRIYRFLRSDPGKWPRRMAVSVLYPDWLTRALTRIHATVNVARGRPTMYRMEVTGGWLSIRHDYTFVAESIFHAEDKEATP